MISYFLTTQTLNSQVLTVNDFTSIFAEKLSPAFQSLEPVFCDKDPTFVIPWPYPLYFPEGTVPVPAAGVSVW